MTSKKIFLCILAILLSIEFASAATLNVGAGQTYTAIQPAIDAATAGDMISVSEGIYVENLVIRTNGISVIGKNKEKTIIDGKKTGSVIRIDSADNVIISGFTINNSGGSGKEDAGVTLYSAKNSMVVNNIIQNNMAGISIYQSGNSNVIAGNDISSNAKNGIYVYSSQDNKIYDNNIRSNQFGIYADSTNTNSIYSNNLIDNKNQAYDNSGKNSWDDGKSGNYWSTYSGSGAFTILGGANARDNYPLSKPAIIKDVPVPTPSEPKVQTTGQLMAQGDAAKSTPGFTWVAVLVSLVTVAALRIRTKYWTK